MVKSILGFGEGVKLLMYVGTELEIEHTAHISQTSTRVPRTYRDIIQV
jgi:hypothetical protein